MAKTKRRYDRRKKAKSNRQISNAHTDNHHLLYQKRHYTGILAGLRNYQYCIISIPKNTLHRQIHEHLGNIPAPRPANAREALWQLKTLYRYGGIHDDDDIETRLKVLISLFECIEQPTADALKKQLAIVQEYKSSH